jgi:ABC-type lipoprotein release transport system permease subunit
MRTLKRITGVAFIVLGSLVLIVCAAWAESVPSAAPAQRGSGLKFLPEPHVTASVGVGHFGVELSPTQVVLVALAAFVLLNVAGVLLIRHEGQTEGP